MAGAMLPVHCFVTSVIDVHGHQTVMLARRRTSNASVGTGTSCGPPARLVCPQAQPRRKHRHGAAQRQQQAVNPPEVAFTAAATITALRRRAIAAAAAAGVGPQQQGLLQERDQPSHQLAQPHALADVGKPKHAAQVGGHVGEDELQGVRRGEGGGKSEAICVVGEGELR